MYNFRCVIDVLVKGNKKNQIKISVDYPVLITRDKVYEFVKEMYGIDVDTDGLPEYQLTRRLVELLILAVVAHDKRKGTNGSGEDEEEVVLLIQSLSTLIGCNKWFAEIDTFHSDPQRFSIRWLATPDHTYQPYGPMASPEDKEVTIDCLKHYED